MGLYRKKPIVIEAELWDGERVPSFMADTHTYAVAGADLLIPTPEGVMTAGPGDWVIKGVKGEVYPCKPDIFAATYDPAPADTGD